MGTVLSVRLMFGISVTDKWQSGDLSEIEVYFFYDVKDGCRSSNESWYCGCVFLRDPASVCVPALSRTPFLKSHDSQYWLEYPLSHLHPRQLVVTGREREEHMLSLLEDPSPTHFHLIG